MNCDEAREMLAGYADGELSPVENDAIAAHLEQCGRCRQTVHDQQRVQVVLTQYDPPPVPDAVWDEIGRQLRAELVGDAEPAQLKTLPPIQDNEPTPAAGPPLETESEAEGEPGEPEPEAPAIQTLEAALGEADTTPAPRVAREVPAPGPGSAGQAGRRPATVMSLQRPRQGAHDRMGWTAHLVGLAAAAAIILLSLAAILLDRAPPLTAEALARPDDVDIIEMEADPSCNVVLHTADMEGAMAIWLEPEDPNG